MSTRDSSRVIDGFLSLEGGVDSGVAPSLINPNQCAWAVNTTFRGGWPTARPGWKKLPVIFSEGSDSGLFQGAGTFIDNDRDSRLCYSLSGRLWSINLSKGFLMEEFTPATTNNPTLRHAWFQAAEGYMIVQDGESRPVIWDTVTSIRAADNQVPIGGPMAYGQGRLWVAINNQYVGGDLVNSTDKGRASILYFTENTYLNEGGSFGVPSTITGMAFAANLDTALGTGDLLVFTAGSCFAFNAPVDRTVWKDLQYPIQRFALIDFGSFNHESIVTMNGDLAFRSEDGIRSLIYARRDFSEWGNTPISRQVQRALKYDTMSLLYAASAVNFDNRMLMTTQPAFSVDYGVWHRGLVALDYHMVSGMGTKLAPAWEGPWCGVRILRVITQRVFGVNRCFMFVLSDENQVELWEITRADAFDFNGEDEVPIQWIMESRSTAFGDPFDVKELMGAENWIDQLTGEGTINAYYRHDNMEVWTPWENWSGYAEYKSCTAATPPDCQTIIYLRPQTREAFPFTTPRNVSDSQNGGYRHWGYEFQWRYEMTGRFRLKRVMMKAQNKMETLNQPQVGLTCPTQPEGSCEIGNATVQGCDPPDYSYNANVIE